MAGTFIGDTAAGGTAKYTKSVDSVEVYANPTDDNNPNLYALPDIAQHYETVSALATTKTTGVTFSFLYTANSKNTGKQSTVGNICPYKGVTLLVHLYIVPSTLCVQHVASEDTLPRG